MEIVEIEPDILNIDSFTIPEFKFEHSFDNNDDALSKKSTANFGGGIELLMNIKNKIEFQYLLISLSYLILCFSCFF